MNLETLLKDTANTYMAATLAKRVTGDVVRRVPYSSLGTIALASAITGYCLARHFWISSSAGSLRHRA
jgi:hypothetical protein